MDAMSVREAAAHWGISERSVRNYCAHGRIQGATLIGKTWSIPQDAAKPTRTNASVSPLLQQLRHEMKHGIKGGIYHKIQIELTYNSNHIEGSTLSIDQTRYIFETATLSLLSSSDTDTAHSTPPRIDDIIETVNHFHAIDFVITHATEQLSAVMLKELHRILKSSTTNSRKDWFAVGEYKRLPNEVGGRPTTPPEDVALEISSLLSTYEPRRRHSFDEIIEFHHKFEQIHPFQDGNGRVGRLVMLKECLASEVTPFIITDDLKLFYYQGLARWDERPGFLRETCMEAQERCAAMLEYFRIPVNASRP